MVWFNLINKDSSDYYFGECNCGCGYTLTKPRRFPSREFAQEFAESKALKRYRPMVEVDTSWVDRETERFTDGTYSKVLWADENWWLAGPAQRYTNLFLHNSTKQFGMVAYTENPEKGMLDIQVSMTPGRFLTRFCQDYLNADQIKLYAEQYREATVKNLKLLWAETPDEIEAVYSMPASFRSCMQYDAEHFDTHIHPVRIYGAGDLALAYILKDFKLIARALVWRDKKLVGRVYGDGIVLRKALKDYGINTECDNFNFDRFEGARLLKMQHLDGYIAPYLDGICTVVVKDDYLVITTSGAENRINFHTQTGRVSGTPICRHCGARASTDYHDSDGHRHHVCNNCRETFCYYDCFSGNNYSWQVPYLTMTNNVNGPSYARVLSVRIVTEPSPNLYGNLPRNTVFLWNDKYYFAMAIRVFADGRYCPKSESNKIGFQDSFTDVWYHRDQLVMVEDKMLGPLSVSRFCDLVDGKYVPNDDFPREDMFIETTTVFNGNNLEWKVATRRLVAGSEVRAIQQAVDTYF